MKDFNIGDKVIFNFNSNANTTNYTRELTIKYMVENCRYTIQDSKQFSKWEKHLMFKEESTHGYWYPSSCFRRFPIRIVMKERYNLK